MLTMSLIRVNRHVMHHRPVSEIDRIVTRMTRIKCRTYLNLTCFLSNFCVVILDQTFREVLESTFALILHDMCAEKYLGLYADT